MENIDITWLIQIIVTVIGLVLIRYIIPYLQNKVVEIGNDDLDFWLDFVIMAAEEKYKDIASSGKLKFTYAKQLLEKQGFTYDEETIEALINGKVKELFNWDDGSTEKVGGTDE